MIFKSQLPTEGRLIRYPLMRIVAIGPLLLIRVIVFLHRAF